MTGWILARSRQNKTKTAWLRIDLFLPFCVSPWQACKRSSKEKVNEKMWEAKDRRNKIEREGERRRKSSQIFYSLLNLSVVVVRVASTQQSPGFLQRLLNDFTSSSHCSTQHFTLPHVLICSRKQALERKQGWHNTEQRHHWKYKNFNLSRSLWISAKTDTNVISWLWKFWSCASQSICMWLL